MRNAEVKLDQLWEELAKVGVERATAVYSGSGDQGSWDDLIVKSEQPVELLNIKIVCQETYDVFTEAKVWETREKTVEKSLHDYVLWVADQLLEQEHDGWEINEGGFGDLVFDVAERQATLHHNYYVPETHTTTWS